MNRQTSRAQDIVLPPYRSGAGGVDAQGIGKPAVPDLTSIEDARRHLGEMLGLGISIPENVLRAAIEDANYAHNLMVRKNSRKSLRAFIKAPLSPNAPSVVIRDERETLRRFREAMVRWAKVYFTVVDAETKMRRTTACAKCEHISDAPATLLYRIAGLFRPNQEKICNLCGCLLSKKIMMPTESCPAPHLTERGLSRWGEPVASPQDQ